MKAKWTNGGKSLKNGQSRKFCGWSREGIEKYNENYERTEMQRISNKRYDDELLVILQKENEKYMRKNDKEIHKNEEFRGCKVRNGFEEPIKTGEGDKDEMESYGSYESEDSED